MRVAAELPAIRLVYEVGRAHALEQRRGVRGGRFAVVHPLNYKGADEYLAPGLRLPAPLFSASGMAEIEWPIENASLRLYN